MGKNSSPPFAMIALAILVGAPVLALLFAVGSAGLLVAIGAAFRVNDTWGIVTVVVIAYIAIYSFIRICMPSVKGTRSCRRR